jgi:hypothetical protein
LGIRRDPNRCAATATLVCARRQFRTPMQAWTLRVTVRALLSSSRRSG